MNLSYQRSISLSQTVVLNHEEIFSQNLEGPHYEKMMSAKGFEGVTPTGNCPDPAIQSSGSDDGEQTSIKRLLYFL